MKTTLRLAKWWLVVLLATTVVARGQTNDLTALLQQGLLEEQANQNLDAAITDYQALATQFDKDRKVAATAVFRIGECYRMQGRTNEAAAQYGRVLRDFPDQKVLANLSRENLKGMGAVFQERLANIINRSQPEVATPAMSAEASSLAGQIDGIEKLSSDPEEQGRAVQAIFPDENLIGMLLHLTPLQSQLAELTANPNLTLKDLQDEGHGVAVASSDGSGGWLIGDGYAPTLKTNMLPVIKEAMDKQMSMIRRRVDFILKNQKARLKVLQAVTGQAASFGAPSANDEEDKEIQRIQELIQNSPDLINAARWSGHTELAEAAAAGRFKVVAYLLDHGADINRGDHGYPPLYAAANAGNRAMAEFLLNHGADVNVKGGADETPLQLAAAEKFQAVVEVLLAHKADVNAVNNNNLTALEGAAMARDLKIVQSLLAAGADPNVKGKDERTALIYAIAVDSVEIVQALLAAGADAGVEDDKGRTPLSYAAERNDSRLVKLLLEAKADPNGGKIDAPLLLAVLGKNISSAQLLLEHGADANAQGQIGTLDPDQLGLTSKLLAYHQRANSGARPLPLAVESDDLPMVQLLLKFKAGVVPGPDGWPPLFSALLHTNILETLLNAGAKVDAISPTSERVTPLSRAVDQNQISAVAVLLEHGANPNARESNGFTPLHRAAFDLISRQISGQAARQIFELLLAHEASPNVRNDDGETPLDILKKKATPGFELQRGDNVLAGQLANLLRQHGARDKLPDWNRIAISRPAIGFSTPIFYTGTNDWNHFTLLEAILAFYEPGRQYGVPEPNNGQRICGADDALPFPDLAHIVIVRPGRDTTNDTRIKVNVLNSTNGFDLSKDVPLEFGDVVEIPELDHPLGARNVGLTASTAGISDRLKGTVHLTAGGQTVKITLDPMPMRSTLSVMLDGNEARGILLSSSDLSRVKVTRQDPKTGGKLEWTVDEIASSRDLGQQVQLSYNWFPNSSMNRSVAAREIDLWLRDGDVIEVPEKQ